MIEWQLGRSNADGIETKWERNFRRWRYVACLGSSRFASGHDGRLVTASPIGDSAPVLLAQRQGGLVRYKTANAVPISDFFVAYHKRDGEDEILKISWFHDSIATRLRRL